MWTVAALYRFQRVESPDALAAQLRARCVASGVCGTLIIAREGINGTIAAESGERLDEVLKFIRTQFDELELKYSSAAAKPFGRMKVKVKTEIVTMGVPQVDPTSRVGNYVGAAEWNALIADPEVVVIDTRNSFEFDKGTFERAVDPGTKSFKEFPEYVAKTLDPRVHKKIAMFCTGGIRCEKASSFLIGMGFEQVFHLKGGILKYLEDVPAEQSKWSGRCFVFDERVSLGHKLSED